MAVVITLVVVSVSIVTMMGLCTCLAWGVPSGHIKRAKVDGGFDRLSFYDCDVPDGVWEVVKHEDVPSEVIRKIVDYVTWAVLGWS